MLYSRPDLMHRMLAINADAVAAYLNAQIDAGAQAVMIFDSWGGVLADGAFQEFSLAYTARVLAQLKREHDGAPHPAHRLHQGRRPVAGGDGRRSTARCWAWTGPSTWRRARALVGGGAGQGAAGQHRPQRAVRPARADRGRGGDACCESFGAPHAGAARPGPTHIFNLGHGISQHTPPEHVAVLVDAVHAHSRARCASDRRAARVTVI